MLLAAAVIQVCGKGVISPKMSPMICRVVFAGGEKKHKSVVY